jgi:hypothetical protein
MSRVPSARCGFFRLVGDRMARPKLSDEAKIQDMFFDLSVENQERLLETLHMLHRLRKRQPDIEPAETVNQ